VQCHAEHSAATPLLPAYESLDWLHVLPPHISPPVQIEVNAFKHQHKASFQMLELSI
jgi:hypothetical protein